MGKLKEFYMELEEQLYREDAMLEEEEMVEYATILMTDYALAMQNPLARHLSESELLKAVRVAKDETEMDDNLKDKLYNYYVGTGELPCSAAGEDLYGWITEQLTNDLIG
jgi:hypothetical protein